MPRVLINLNRHDHSWSAGHESDAGLLEEFDTGTRDEAIAWAAARSTNILIFDPTQGEFIPLHRASSQR